MVKGASITLRQRVMRGEELLVEASVRVAFISDGRARPIPKPLRIAMKADLDTRAGDYLEMRYPLARMIFSDNRLHPRIKSGAGFFGIML